MSAGANNNEVQGHSIFARARGILPARRIPAKTCGAPRPPHKIWSCAVAKCGTSSALGDLRRLTLQRRKLSATEWRQRVAHGDSRGTTCDERVEPRRGDRQAAGRAFLSRLRGSSLNADPHGSPWATLWRCSAAQCSDCATFPQSLNRGPVPRGEHEVNNPDLP